MKYNSLLTFFIHIKQFKYKNKNWLVIFQISLQYNKITNQQSTCTVLKFKLLINLTISNQLIEFKVKKEISNKEPTPILLYSSNQMNSSQLIQFNKGKCIQLIGGTLGIYLTYLALGVIQQWLIKYPYINTETGQQQKFQSLINILLMPHGTTFIIGSIYNYFAIAKQQTTIIPNRNSFSCASFIIIGGVTFNYAILWTSYPIVITVKSCNLLSVILIATLCSRVSDKKLKLSKQKIIIGILVSIGILLFKFFDPEVKQGDDKKVQIAGFVVLFISLLADGFLPDFQAEIKSKFNPKPTQMMVQINKWVFILCLVYAIFTGQALKVFQFALTHKLFGYHIVGLSLLSCLGHFIIYRMIKTFKQHIVPFVITTRKVFTVCISLIFYNHPTSIGQIFGILIVLGIVVYQFLSQLLISNKKSIKQMQKINSDEKQQKQQILSSSTSTQSASPQINLNVKT